MITREEIDKMRVVEIYKYVANYTTFLTHKKVDLDVKRSPKLYKEINRLKKEREKYNNIHSEIHRDIHSGKDTYKFWTEQLQSDKEFMKFLKESFDI